MFEKKHDELNVLLQKHFIPLNFLKTFLHIFNNFVVSLNEIFLKSCQKQRKILNQRTETVIMIISTMLLTPTQIMKYSLKIVKIDTNYQNMHDHAKIIIKIGKLM